MYAISFCFGKFKAVYHGTFVYFVDTLLQLAFCYTYIFGCRGNAEVIIEQIFTNSRIQAIGDVIDFHIEKGY